MSYIDYEDNKYYFFNSNYELKFYFPNLHECNNIIKKLYSGKYDNTIYNEIDNLQSNDNYQYIKYIKSIIPDNRCIECNRNLGDSNPRQYCYKTYCGFVNKYDD